MMLYLFGDQGLELSEAQEIVQRSGCDFELVVAEDHVQVARWHGTLPALVTPQGTWYGLDEIRAFVRIPATIPEEEAV